MVCAVARSSDKLSMSYSTWQYLRRYRPVVRLHDPVLGLSDSKVASEKDVMSQP